MTQPLRQVAENVWLYPRGKVREDSEPNIGVIGTANGSVLVDAGNGPPHARRLTAALQAMKLPPVTTIIYTHHHWDHVFGASVLGAPAVGHAMCREYLLQSAAEPWSRAYLQELTGRYPRWIGTYQAMDRAVDDWTGFKIVVPTITFTEAHRLEQGGVVMEMEHVGGAHARDSIVVRVQGVVFLGDCYYGRPGADSGAEWPLLERLLEQPAELYIDGHLGPLRRAELAKMKRFKLFRGGE